MKKIAKLLYVLLTLLPLVAVSQHKPTSYDSDGDGIPDSIDKCVLVPGTAQFHGCPFEPRITADDRDGDGIPDVYDACPDMFGVSANHGCPDIAMISNPPHGKDSKEIAPESNTSMFTNISSADQAEMDSFKNNLIRILASSGRMFADIKTTIEPQVNDYGTALCLAGANECFIDNKGQHFYATYGTFNTLEAAMNQYDKLRKILVESLGETQWQMLETTEDGYKRFEMKKNVSGQSFAPQVKTFVRQTHDNEYKVYLTIDSRPSL